MTLFFFVIIEYTPKLCVKVLTWSLCPSLMQSRDVISRTKKNRLPHKVHL